MYSNLSYLCIYRHLIYYKIKDLKNVTSTWLVFNSVYCLNHIYTHTNNLTRFKSIIHRDFWMIIYKSDENLFLNSWIQFCFIIISTVKSSTEFFSCCYNILFQKRQYHFSLLRTILIKCNRRYKWIKNSRYWERMICQKIQRFKSLYGDKYTFNRYNWLLAVRVTIYHILRHHIIEFQILIKDW